MLPSHRRALAEGLLVSLVWSSSFVIIKVGLTYLPPLTLAGLRYFSAFLLLLPVVVVTRRPPSQALDRGVWPRLVLMGLAAFLVGNGLLFWSLLVLPATTGAFLYSFTPVMVLLLGMLTLHEFPSRLQVVGITLAAFGSYVFFAVRLSLAELRAVFALLVSTVAFAVFGVLARGFARDDRLSSFDLTAWPLCFGGAALLLVAWLVEGRPTLTMPALQVILWLSLINTVLAYILWNHALRTLKAFELNMLANVTPLATAVMAWFTLHEPLTPRQVIGILIVLAGVSLVQWAGR